MAGAVHTEAYRFLRRELVRLRRSAGFSQAALAKELGKPPSYVAKYELGERRLDAVELCIILKALSTEPEVFFGKLFSLSPGKL
ncbi:helix-turn-helix domain-containing protein [Roseobacter sp. GAI101]|uniref:helix-turn-helix domain-containing protein n=1 Tax=Roseobacter sp. (strain GAI101) TaxID=391589 RepID=UPI000A0579A8